jgi:heme A synthase
LIFSHFTALVVFAVIVSTVFALITKSEPREQLRYGLFVFASFIAVAVVVGWIMYPLPR